jgi:hypothetical protein
MIELRVLMERLAKPRRIVVCNPADYPQMKQTIIDLGYGDVLVTPNSFVSAGQGYVFDPSLMDRSFVWFGDGEGF